MKNTFKQIIKSLILTTFVAVLFGASIPVNTGTDNQTATKNYLVETVYAEQTEEELETEKEIKAELEEEIKEKMKESIDIDETIREIVSKARVIHRVTYPLVHFFAFKIGDFLGNDYIFAGGMGTMLKEVWIISRNIVNIIFVLLLLFMALKYIFNPKQELGSLKTDLGIFALILISVNFSWLGTKLVLDTANVATNVVFAIPSGIKTAWDGLNPEPCAIVDGKTTGICYPSEMYYVPSKDIINVHEDECKKQKIGEEFKNIYGENKEAEEGGLLINTEDKTIIATVGGKNATSVFCWDNLDPSKFDQNTSSVYLTYGIARIQNLIQKEDGDILHLVTNVLFSILIFIVYLISLGALFIALIVRVAFLWIFVAFSPFLVLMLYMKVANVGGGSLGEIESKFSIGQFMRWSFVPTAIGAIFSVSFIMLAAGQALASKKEKIFESFMDGTAVTMKIYSSNSLFAGLDSWQQVIWLIMTTVILWMGVFQIVNGLPIVSSITKPVYGALNRGAQLIGQYPYMAPIIPMGKGGKKSMKSIFDKSLNINKRLSESYGTTDINNSVRAANKFGESDKFEGFKKALNDSDFTEAIRLLKSSGSSSEIMKNDKGIKLILSKAGSSITSEEFKKKYDGKRVEEKPKQPEPVPVKKEVKDVEVKPELGSDGKPIKKEEKKK